MFDLSIWEIGIVIIVSIIILKPEDVPEVLKQGGKLFRKIREFFSEVSAVLDLNEKKEIKPNNKIIGLDGKEHNAYDVKEVFGNKHESE